MTYSRNIITDSFARIEPFIVTGLAGWRARRTRSASPPVLGVSADSLSPALTRGDNMDRQIQRESQSRRRRTVWRHEFAAAWACLDADRPSSEFASRIVATASRKAP